MSRSEALKLMHSDFEDSSYLDQEKRLAKYRETIHVSEGITVEIVTKNGQINGLLFDVGLHGIGVGVKGPEHWTISDNCREIEVTIQPAIGGGSWSMQGLIRNRSVVKYSHGEYQKIGIELQPASISELRRLQFLGYHEHRCPEFYHPMASAPDKIFFGEFLHFHITSIYPKGFSALTSFRNKGLFPGMELDCDVMVPNQGPFCIRCQIIGVKANLQIRREKT